MSLAYSHIINFIDEIIMSLFLSTVGSATAPAANELRALAVFKESACQCFRVGPTAQPQATVTYTTGTPRIVGTTLYVPVTATMNATVSTGCCNAKPLLFSETFLAAFQGVTTLPAAITVTSLGQEVLTPIGTGCGWTKCITVNDSLLITITPAAAPGA